MKNGGLIIGGGVIIAILLLWLAIEIDDKKRLKKDNQNLKEDRLKLLKEYLKIAKEIPSEIKTQIEKLVIEYDDLDPKVAKELLNVLSLIEQKMEPKAIATLAKIIENLLKDKYAKKMLLGKYSTEEEFLKKKKKITLYKVMEFAKIENFLSDSEYNLATILRGFRNQSSHELDPQISNANQGLKMKM